jgi:hypothetical protein
MQLTKRGIWAPRRAAPEPAWPDEAPAFVPRRDARPTRSLALPAPWSPRPAAAYAPEGISRPAPAPLALTLAEAWLDRALVMEERRRRAEDGWPRLPAPIAAHPV